MRWSYDRAITWSKACEFKRLPSQTSREGGAWTTDRDRALPSSSTRDSFIRQAELSPHLRRRVQHIEPQSIQECDDCLFERRIERHEERF